MRKNTTHFTKKGNKFKIFDGTEEPEEIFLNLKGLRELKIPPNEVKLWPILYAKYLEFCKEYVFCNSCGDVLLKKNAKSLNKTTFFCFKEECQKNHTILCENIRKKSKNTRILNEGKHNYRSHIKLNLEGYILKGYCKAQVKALKGLSPEEKTIIYKYLDEHTLCSKCKKIIKKEESLGVWDSKKFCKECFTGVDTELYISAKKEKITSTNKENLGVEWPSQSPEVISVIKANNLAKYGVEWNFQRQDVKDSIKATCMCKWGYPNPAMVPEIKEKIRESTTIKWGSPYASKNESIKEKISLSLDKCKDISKKMIIDLCKEKDSIVIVDFEKVCRSLKISPTTLRKLLTIYNINYRPLYKRFPKAQCEIFQKICVNYKILNDKNILSGKELDIFLPDYKLAIEYDGLLFHSQGVSKHSIFNKPDFDKNYHLQKTLECNSQGIQLLHIFEGENIDLWVSMINAKLGLNSRIYARNCYAVELRNSDLKEFLSENHLQGFCNASIAIGLYHKFSDGEKLVAVMTFSKPRFSKGYDYELVRFCSLKGYNIVGGASKLWKFFLKKYNPKSVISYANLRFSSGGLYENLGFSLKHRSEPNYYYFKSNEGILHSRNKFQKHKLKDLLENFDADKSEVENMFANGYRRIFDCGNLVYEWFAK